MISTTQSSLLKPAQKRDGKFLNPVPTTVGSGSTMFKALRKYLTGPKQETQPRQALGPFVTDASVYAKPPQSGLRVTWFGHSSMLVEIDGVGVLIDPVWDERASPVSWAGPKRFFAPTIALADLPPIDVVLISHDHYDHLGSQTVKAMASLPPFAEARWITSLGVGKRLSKFGVASERIQELDWTQSVTVAGSASLKITALPARHFSGRTPLDRFTTLWSSFVIEGSVHRIYYGADSGWWDGFAEIGERFGPFDLTMLEIGAFDPLWEQIHLGPDHAARAYEAMGGAARAGLLMPIHWGLFNLALHSWRQPIERIADVSRKKVLPLWSPKPGVPTEIIGEPLVSDWWKRAGDSAR